MRLIPETAAELGSNVRWVVAKRLEIIEEFALGLQTPGSDIPDIHEAGKRILRAVERRDRKAEDEAFVDRTRAEVWEWWQGFSEHRLLTDLYGRAVLREAGCGDPDKQRLPTHSQGLRIARALLAEISDGGASWIPSRRPPPLPKFWRTSCCLPSPHPLGPCCELTSGAQGTAVSTSTRSALSTRR